MRFAFASAGAVMAGNAPAARRDMMRGEYARGGDTREFSRVQRTAALPSGFSQFIKRFSQTTFPVKQS